MCWVWERRCSVEFPVSQEKERECVCYVCFNVVASACGGFRLMWLEELSASWVRKIYDLMSMGG